LKKESLFFQILISRVNSEMTSESETAPLVQLEEPTEEEVLATRPEKSVKKTKADKEMEKADALKRMQEAQKKKEEEQKKKEEEQKQKEESKRLTVQEKAKKQAEKEAKAAEKAKKDADKEARLNKLRNLNQEKRQMAVDVVSTVANPIDLTDFNDIAGMNLSHFNSNFQSDLVNGITNFLINLRAYLDSADAKDPRHIETPANFIDFVDQLVKNMNLWCSVIDFMGSEPKIAIRAQKGENYGYYFMTLKGFSKMLKSFTVWGFEQSDINKLAIYDTRRKFNPQFPMKDGVPIVDIYLKELKVSELWLTHKHCLHFNKLVCNPRPKHFKNAANPRDLNTWSGFRWTR
jgi:hypothetical protein